MPAALLASSSSARRSMSPSSATSCPTASSSSCTRIIALPSVVVEPALPRRLQGRAARAHRLRAPLRAPHVHGHQERPQRHASTPSSKAPAATTTRRPTRTAPTTSTPARRTCSRPFLWLEADRLSTLPDDMTKAKVDLQRDVVKNERRQSYENRPYGRAELVIPDKLYPPAHPYHHPVIGSHADLDAASVEDVKAFFRQFYVPSNASLVIAGDFATADAKRLVDKYFAWMPKRPVPPHAAPQAGDAGESRCACALTDAVQLPRVNAGVALAGGVRRRRRRVRSAGRAPRRRPLVAALSGAGLRQEARRVGRGRAADARSTGRSSSSWRRRSRATPSPSWSRRSTPSWRASTASRRRDGELERARAFVQTKLLHEIEPRGAARRLAQLFEIRFGDAGRARQALPRPLRRRRPRPRSPRGRRRCCTRRASPSSSSPRGGGK